ncbi:conserved protein of unknown function [Bradyrhizobium sp. ORS 285]|uniref:hypothetical protein n=1 Tax=Bradyrhizobium sp. ORS 285 TaxID=115808 RepID=UPI0002407E98|nr:hypothetical protein [Bradyrhizobium sp. ORS 285]CCD86781.1 conserved hypothetical protein [Bradyrhizobium sp. ORS 285]SMX57693.1 conserved protein of unknown function [Bradyrhizobium sp. ORS 285]
MTRMTSQDSKQDSTQDPEICDHARALSSPVALAFVRIAMACRGVSEATAQQIYLDYIHGSASEHAPDDVRCPAGHQHQ